jgi:predicted amidohydrolase YtcJ
MPVAQALAVRDGLIIAAGSDPQILRYIGEKTEVIDLDGRLAIPGFIEGHAHLLSLGRSRMRLDLSTARTWEEIVAMVQYAAESVGPEEWILGRGWHQEKWIETPKPNVDGLPYHYALSQVSDDNPVWLTHASGHSPIVNPKAMELAGITRDTPDPEGGQIVRDPEGNPIGVVLETAEELLQTTYDSSVAGRSPDQIRSERWKAIGLAIQECLSKGITSFHDAGSSFETIELFKEMADRGELGIRLWVMISDSNYIVRGKLSDYPLIDYGDHKLTVRAIKRHIDGALGSHGAWLLEPYADLPSSSGLNTTSIEEIRESADIAENHGFQLCTHAIGDRANRVMLDIYEDVFRTHPEQTNLRWRIEHAQHLHPEDIPRFGQLSVIAAMQGVHCTSDGPWVAKRIGFRRAQEGAYVWSKLLQSGAVIANGTDAPVENVDPIANIYASITRRLHDGSQFFPDQCLTREEALRSYTINCAFAAFEEDTKGSLSPGKLADITVLSKDIMIVPEEEILKTRVDYTIVGGKIMYQGSQ